MKYTDIYVKADISLEKMSELVHLATGVELKSFEDRGTFFAGLNNDRRFSVQANVFKDDTEEETGGFTFDIDIDGSDDDERIAVARTLFDTLKASKVGDLLLLDERQGELDRFTLD